MAKGKSVTVPSLHGSFIFTNDLDDEVSIAEAPDTIVPHPEFFLDNTLTAIQIEKTLYNVHKYQLMKSEFFSDMFKAPKTDENEVEAGSSPKHPIVIKGISASDFSALLSVLYAR
ncbi:unnamed protein product [Rhizoctonia solani]|uniref:BTB domain-containing protein n=1 Tax=Rhizoctonia solani TaxID=456999 RepID=A0A8H3BZC5_9AGAM|nr:unnamed protein product [Rhizoctonia solani]